MQPVSEKNWIVRALASGVLKAIAFYVATVAGPFVVAAATFAAGAIDNSVSWMWVFMATSVAFAGAVVGILRFYELLQKTRIDGNLNCVSPSIGMDLNEPNGIWLGVNLQSNGDVPIEFEVQSLRTRLQGKYPPNKPYELKKLTIPPRGFAFFNDHAINVDPPSSASVAGLIDMEIKYGRPGNLKYSLRIKRQVFLKFGSERQLENIAWTEMS